MVSTFPQAQQFEGERYLEAPVSPNARGLSAEQRRSLAELVPADGRILKFHRSLCPACVSEAEWHRMLIPSAVYVKGGKVWMIKECSRHGPFKELYWSDFGMYEKAEGFQDPGIELETLHIPKKAGDIACPLDCGLCMEHETHTNLGNIVLTNRCDLSCWYCFFYAKKGQPVYEPSLGQIKQMLHTLRNQKPIVTNAIQLTGGEPLMRDDIERIIEIAKEEGFDHIQLNTNGIRLSQEPELVKRIAALGSHVLYMSFDGVTPQTNPKNYWEVPKALENCRQAGIGVVLVPTVINGFNDHEVGDIIRFGAGNIDVIRGVNYQPVSFVGQMPDRLRVKQRITIPGVIRRIEEQTSGEIRAEDFYPVPVAKQVTDFIEAMRGRPVYRLSEHFACGMATYVFKDGDKMVPLPRFFDVEGFFEFLSQTGEEFRGLPLKALRKPAVYAKLLFGMKRFLDEGKKPKDLKFVRSLFAAFTGANYKGLGVMHHDALFVGMMHFQDPYNWDIDRIHKCGIHYAVPDGRLIPFCTFNVIPGLFRDKIQEEFSIPSDEWERRTGKRLENDKYKRKISEAEKREVDRFYASFMGKPRKHKDDEWGSEPAKPTRRRITSMQAAKKPMEAETALRSAAKTTATAAKAGRKPITRNMLIAEAVSEYPETVPVLIEAGIHCLGCSMVGMETLEEGLKSHGKTDKKIEEIIRKMRKATGR